MPSYLLNKCEVLNELPDFTFKLYGTSLKYEDPKIRQETIQLCTKRKTYIWSNGIEIFFSTSFLDRLALLSQLVAASCKVFTKEISLIRSVILMMLVEAVYCFETSVLAATKIDELTLYYFRPGSSMKKYHSKLCIQNESSCGLDDYTK
ncbi:uncharacterized protein EV154DRAFT_549814 [Mucor mucedo]|uniref:uncharacterized protein n=1 Tax=Mucor mucedo TaxID=29922 RepID=UPI00221E5978|nr:uncharacterized protein EV154DRAFT_549814 [Mucor mucedo]KAI7893480.1 hypothetical protein EV154DRAFT_549814 [Mucor mucedo]